MRKGRAGEKGEEVQGEEGTRERGGAQRGEASPVLDVNLIVVKPTFIITCIGRLTDEGAYRGSVKISGGRQYGERNGANSIPALR